MFIFPQDLGSGLAQAAQSASGGLERRWMDERRWDRDRADRNQSMQAEAALNEALDGIAARMEQPFGRRLDVIENVLVQMANKLMNVEQAISVGRTDRTAAPGDI